MNYLKIENLLTNLGFYLLFFSVLFFWVQALLIKNQTLFFLGKFFVLISNLIIGCFLILRWFESKHFPLSNLYESLIFLSWGLTLVFFIIDLKIKRQNTNELYSSIPTFFYKGVENSISETEINLFSTKSVQVYNNLNDTKYYPEPNYLIILGSVLTPIALLINAFASFSLPIELRQISPLVPALQSNWLMMHVSVMMLSYTALISGCLFSIVFLFLTKCQDINLQETSMGNKFSGEKNQQENKKNENPFPESKKETIDFFVQNVNLAKSIPQKDFSLTEPKTNVLINQKNQTTLNFFSSFFDENSQLKINNNIEHAKTFDNLSYRTLSLGFSFLTIGILSGAVWANEAWGSYWSWDPKETWALITWIIFAIYLHTRLNRGWQGRNSALIAVLGLIIVCICYLGVNFLGKGLHSYGFLN